MKTNLSALVLVSLLAALGGGPSRADGLIVVNPPPQVSWRHFPLAPLEVTYHHVNVKIDGQICTTTVDEDFYNPNQRVLEGTYIFPVPKDAQIDKFTMQIGGQDVPAELLPADKARAIYEQIVRDRLDPALMEYAGR
ncbi:MAG TPA: VIT domain-containing protein, partial [Candidatus Methylacidiphilales bacterium]|nr:VIT domain-containing protein [Candidatus Methylacidiphilales bacterium]